MGAFFKKFSGGGGIFFLEYSNKKLFFLLLEIWTGALKNKGGGGGKGGGPIFFFQDFVIPLPFQNKKKETPNFGLLSKTGEASQKTGNGAGSQKRILRLSLKQKVKKKN